MVSLLSFTEKLIERALLPFSEKIPIFVILLESDHERRAHVYGHTKRRLPRCSVVSAIQQDGVKAFFESEKVAVSADLTLSKLACSASHMKVWKKISTSETPYAIVLEDDVAVLPDFELFAQRLVRKIPQNADLVHLYVSHNRAHWGRQVAKTKRAFVSYKPRWGRSAYLLSRRGAEKLLSGFRTIADHGDIQMANMAERGELSVFCASKECVSNLGQLFRGYRGEKFRSTVW